MSIRVLIVCSGNKGSLSPFIKDQSKALQNLGIKVDYFLIKGNGLFGYLKNLAQLKNRINNFSYDIVHAHYGLAGLLANFQRQLPVTISFHGSDINKVRNRIFSYFAALLSSHSIFVSKELMNLLGLKKKCSVIPCGVDLELFNCDRETIHHKIKLLFSSSFDRSVKNYPLAKEAVSIIQNKLDVKIELIELKGYSREEVSSILNKVNVALLTSYTEGSPQFIKEAMACGCPAVSTNVGDVKHLFGDVSGYYIANLSADDVAEKLMEAIKFSQQIKKTNGRERIKNLGLDSEDVAKKIIMVYKDVIDKK